MAISDRCMRMVRLARGGGRYDTAEQCERGGMAGAPPALHYSVACAWLQ